MESHSKVIRAVTCEFIRRKLKAVALIVFIVVLIVLGITLWLTSINVWWWLLATPIIIVSCLLSLIYLVARLIISKARPEVTKLQARGVKDFVDKLERVSENLQTPAFIIVFKMLRDIVRPRKKAFVLKVAEDSTTLHKDYLELQRMF